ncbi:aldose 1-epimerase family protein [Bordetella sp. 2513F-2]
MTRLYGRDLGRTELARRAGSLAQFAGVRLVTLGDGVERGIRCLEFRTGSGLQFHVLVDRAMDVGPCEYRGAAIGWQSPTGFRHPGLHEYEGEGGLAWLRSFSGLLVTGGLDHTLFMDSAPAGHYHYTPRRSVDSSLHGRVSNLPARLAGYGERWEGDDCILWCEGVVSQATVFGEDLELVRRIEARVGESAFTLHDVVRNRGFYRTPHMFLYHINVGYPVLDEGSRYVAPVRHTPWASHADALQAQGAGCRLQPGPRPGFHEQVYEHAMAADAQGRIPVALVNPGYDGGRGLGFSVEVEAAQFPCQFQWQNYQEGLYAMGIEPSTHHVLGARHAREHDQMIWLEHDESRTYRTRFAVLDGAGEIAAFEERVAAIGTPPLPDYPAITGRFEA